MSGLGLAAAAVAALVPLLLTACASHACTEVACSDDPSVHVSIWGPGDRFSAGKYEISAPDFGATCTYVDTGELPVCVSSSEINADIMTISFSLPYPPSTFQLTIRRDGVVIDSRSVTPVHERRYPNGADCDDGCAEPAGVTVFL